MTLFKEIEEELKLLIEVSRDSGKYNEMLLKYNDLNSKDYSETKCAIIQAKINELEKIYSDIYFKFFRF